MRRRLADLVERVAVAADRRAHLAGDTAALLEVLRADYAESTADAPPIAAADAGDAIDDLRATFGLTDLDCGLLMVAAGAELDVRLAVLYGILLGASDRLRPTAGLALELCGLGSLSAEGRQRLGPGGALRRNRLLAVEGTEPAVLRSLRVPDRVVGHLTGDDTVARQVSPLLIEVPGLRSPDADRLARALRTGAAIGHVRAASGAAGLATAQGCCDILGVAGLVVDLSRRAAGSDPVELVRLAVREAGLRTACLVLAGDDAQIAGNGALFEILEESPVPVVVVDDLGWEHGWSRAPVVSVDATELSTAERAAMWGTVVEPAAAGDDPAGWRSLISLRLSPSDIVAAARVASVLAEADRRPLTMGLLREAARDQRHTRLSTAATRTIPQATLHDLVLPAQTRQAMEELVSWAANRELVLEHSQLAGKGSKGRGLAALFAGSSGTGKTLAAEAVAGELGMELYTVDLSSVIDKYIGETQKQLERVIGEAEKLNVVLFFDEADALFGSRSAVSDSRDRYANQEVSYLLQRIEKFDGLAILATNLRGNLDVAFTRRLHHVISFADPDAGTRRLLWDAHLRELPVLDSDDPIDVDRLAHALELTGGDIRNIVLTAAFGAAAEQRAAEPGRAPVGSRHILQAVEREFRKLGRRPPAGLG